MGKLTPYWLVPHAPPLGFVGVTARSREDAVALLEHQGIRSREQAEACEWIEGVTVPWLEEHYSFAPPNSGPLVVRGVWHPCYNLGYAAERNG